MKYLYIPVERFSTLNLETNRILKWRNSPIRYAKFRNTVEVWYPSDMGREN